MSVLKIKWDRTQDRMLIRKAKRGDTDAFTGLIKKYQRQVYACISGLVFSHASTDDVLQDTFIKVYRNLHRFDENYPFYPWVRRIAVNTALNYLKNEARRQAVSIDAPEDASVMLQAEDNPGRDVEKKEMLEKLREAVKELPEEQRMVFVLRTQQEMSYEEIAQLLEISMGTVMSRLNRARSKLKELLKDHFY